MRGRAESVQLLSAAGAREILALYSKHPDAIPLAGGTDLMVAYNAGLMNDCTVLDISRVKAWKAIRETPTGIVIGALATHAQIAESTHVPRHFKLLAEAAKVVGADQIQNRGTLGGNIANASPAGDTFPALAVYEATIHLASAEGKRSLPILEIFAGVKRTHLASGELIRAIELRRPKPRPTRQLYRKIGTRAAQAISKTVVAGQLWLDREGRVRELRFALGSVATTVKRAATVEEFVRGRRLGPKTIATAVELLLDDISPIDDIRSTREYRAQISQNLLREFLID